jgi:hypothetical protein
MAGIDGICKKKVTARLDVLGLARYYPYARKCWIKVNMWVYEKTI